jgi:hypothetical protein
VEDIVTRTLAVRDASQKPLWSRSALGLAGGLALLAAAFLSGRISATPSAPSPQSLPAGIRFVDGLPTGFANSARGAGTAAAWYVELVSSWSGRPAAQIRPLLQRLVAPGHPDLTDKLLPEPATAGDANIAADLPLRVWTSRGATTTTLTPNAPLSVQVLEVSLYGPRSDGQNPPDAGLAGGWHIVNLTLTWRRGSWRISGWDLTDAPRIATVSSDTATMPPTLTGPDSWTPDTP